MDVKIKFYRKGAEKPIITTDIVDSLKEYENLVSTIYKLKEQQSIVLLEFFDDSVVIDMNEIDYIMISKPVDADISFDYKEDDLDTLSSSEKELEDINVENESVTDVSSSVPAQEGKSKKEPIEKEQYDKIYDLEPEEDMILEDINDLQESETKDVEDLV